jgi:predicted dehydrogenase
MRIGLVGYGYWGPNVAKNLYKNPNFNLVYICDKKKDRLDRARTVYANEIRYTNNYQSLIEDESLDAIAIAVETSSHFELAKQALLSGKHIYVEKPFTTTVSEALELQEIAVQKGLTIHVDHIMVYHPAIRKIKEIIDRGDLGEIFYFDCSRMNLGNIKNDVSSMWDLSVHDLSIIDYLMNGQTPLDVNAVGEIVYSKKHSITLLTAVYPSFLANIKASWLSPIKERKIMIVGTKKMLVYDDVDVINKLIVYDKGFHLHKTLEGLEYDEVVVTSRIGDAVIPKIEVKDALYESLEHFRLCITESKPSISDASSAIRIQTILEKADIKLYNDRRI